MFKTLTTYIKAQTPGISMPALLDLYKQELKYQSVTDVEVNNNYIDFSDELLKITYRGQPNKFVNFSKGRIAIKETEHEYVVTFSADLSRMWNRAGMFNGIALLFIMVAGKMIDQKLLGTQFHKIMLTFFLLYFLVVMIVPYIQVVFLFPVYFTGLRNKFERVIKNPKSQS